MNLLECLGIGAAVVGFAWLLVRLWALLLSRISLD